jgi:hypothetical protein
VMLIFLEGLLRFRVNWISVLQPLRVALRYIVQLTGTL